MGNDVIGKLDCQPQFVSFAVRLLGNAGGGLFVAEDNHLLPLTHLSVTRMGGPDDLSINWDRWFCIYLYPPVLMTLVLQTVL